MVVLCLNIVIIILLILTQFADDEDLQSEWIEAKRRNKLKVVAFLKERTGYSVSPDAMFDIQVTLNFKPF